MLGVGLVVGLALGFSAIIVPRWGEFWFALSLGAVIAVMMVTYVTVPARIVGIKPAASRRDKLAATVVRAACSRVRRFSPDRIDMRITAVSEED